MLIIFTLAHTNIFYLRQNTTCKKICVCLIISLLFGNLSYIIGKPLYAHFKWCHTCQELGRVWVVQLNNMTRSLLSQTAYSAVANDSFFVFLVPPGANLASVWQHL